MMDSGVEEGGAGAALQGQAEILQLLNNTTESMALRCVVELGIPDALNSHHPNPLTLSQLASLVTIPFPSLHIDRLSRLMRFLSSSNVFDATVDNQTGETMYGLTNSSKWLVTNSDKVSLVSTLLFVTHPCFLASFNCLAKSVAEGGACGFARANGSDLYDFQSENDEYKKVFGEAMTCNSRMVTKAVLQCYEDGFKKIGSIVDVGGGSGEAVAQIVNANPHIKGINFDLPYVVGSAPQYPNVTHIGGDMFASIPPADAIFLMWTLHNWSDAECLQILKNCKKALPEKNGKVIIVDAVLDPQGESVFDKVSLRFDLHMMILTPNGKERTEEEWKKLLERGGFSQYNIIKIPSFQSIIEATF